MSRSQSSSPYGSPTRYHQANDNDNAEAGPSRSPSATSHTVPSVSRSNTSGSESTGSGRQRTRTMNDPVEAGAVQRNAEAEQEPSSSRRGRGRPKRASLANVATESQSLLLSSGDRRSRSHVTARKTNPIVLDIPTPMNENTSSRQPDTRRRSLPRSKNAANKKNDKDITPSHVERERERDGFQSREESSKEVSERIKRGWETRRANKRIRLERGEALIHRERERDADPERPHSYSYSQPSGAATAPSTPLPTSQMLLSLHNHSAQFYEANNLIFQPIKKGRANPWGSKKRLLIVQDALSNSRSESAAGSGAGAGGRSSTSLSLSITPAPRSRETQARSDEDEDHDGDEDEDTHRSKVDELDGPGDMRIKSEFVDQYGELIINKNVKRKYGKAKIKSKSADRERNRDRGRSDDDEEYEYGYDKEEKEKDSDQDDEWEDGEGNPDSVRHEEGAGNDDGAAERGSLDKDQDQEEVARKRTKGKYKIRDMYRAIEGRGLMALGESIPSNFPPGAYTFSPVRQRLKLSIRSDDADSSSRLSVD
ncbi:hypothetical protein I317_04001 [Kwoniella heveanensis CBS 569]|nr:hypothetical protein I317_04001 [Kwoniella heveanensis CBS 569]